jgi:hypothetical protein
MRERALDELRRDVIAGAAVMAFASIAVGLSAPCWLMRRSGTRRSAGLKLPSFWLSRQRRRACLFRVARGRLYGEPVCHNAEADQGDDEIGRGFGRVTNNRRSLR